MPVWMAEITAARSKWVDQSISHNVFIKGTSGKKLSDTFLLGWKKGMKTFYYVRSLGASQIEKSTLDAKKFGFTQKREYNNAIVENRPTNQNDSILVKACSISDDPSCDVCQ